MKRPPITSGTRRQPRALCDGVKAQRRIRDTADLDEVHVEPDSRRSPKRSLPTHVNEAPHSESR
jgi:hypothetical protein